VLIPNYSRQFERDAKQAQKRGRDMKKLTTLIKFLLEEKPLPLKNKNHKLNGDFYGYWECHIEPDWLLVYKKTSTEIILARTGTHSDLF